MVLGIFNIWPKKVVLGSGGVKTLGDEIKALGKSKVIVITDQGMKDLPVVTDVVKILEGDGLTVSLYGEIGPNPTDVMVSEAAEFMRKVMPEVIVAVGGGSPIDAAKCVNIVYTHGGIANDYDLAFGGIEKITPKLLPFIAVPTTSGTASEVSLACVITDTRRQLKMSVVSPLLVPDISIVDAEMTLSMPPKLTAFTGMDTLTHLIEAYVSSAGFAPADGMALQGIKLVSKSLRTAVLDGQNLKAREDMIVASMMGGMAFNHNMLGLVHATAHQLSTFFHIPHGLANAILLPRVMRFNLPINLQKFADIAEALGVDIRGLSLREAAEKAVLEVEMLSRDVGIPETLDEIGVSKDQIPAMVERALIDPVINTNPRPVTAGDAEQIYLAAFKG